MEGTLANCRAGIKSDGGVRGWARPFSPLPRSQGGAQQDMPKAPGCAQLGRGPFAEAQRPRDALPWVLQILPWAAICQGPSEGGHGSFQPPWGESDPAQTPAGLFRGAGERGRPPTPLGALLFPAGGQATNLKQPPTVSPQALLETALTRVVLPMPILVLPPIIMSLLEK